MSDTPSSNKPGAVPPARIKRPYEAPAVVSEEVFETLALSCAKSNPLVCPGGNPNRS
ncbi:MAG: hypothetical protein IPL79_13570 [Myxococcales bacterium]|nr:hypothetical protein [Myxococcales bacterium]